MYELEDEHDWKHLLRNDYEEYSFSQYRRHGIHSFLMGAGCSAMAFGASIALFLWVTGVI